MFDDERLSIGQTLAARRRDLCRRQRHEMMERRAMPPTAEATPMTIALC
jgi:hypothetical protein